MLHKKKIKLKGEDLEPSGSQKVYQFSLNY